MCFERYLEYGRALAGSGARGICSGSQSYLAGKPLSAALGESARASLPFAALGIAAGLLQVFSNKHPNSYKEPCGGVCRSHRRVPRSLLVEDT